MNVLYCTQPQETLNLHSAEEALHVVYVHSDSATSDLHIQHSAQSNVETHVIVVLNNTQELTVNHTNTLEAQSTVHTHIATLGTGKTTYTLVNTLNGQRAISNVNWLFYAKQSEQYTLKASNVFNHRDGGGQMLLKGVAEDTAKVNLYGMIDISLQGQGTDTYLTEDVLMLDSTAKVDAIPGLEIKTNDVKASHSAVVSKVTQEDLFYFEARGINETLARTMFIEGFLESVLEPMPTEPKEQVVECIQQKLA